MSRKILLQDLASDIESWILNKLSTRSEVFNGLPPCPYAKSAWLDNKVKVHLITGVQFDPIRHLKAELENYTYHWPKGKEVIVLGVDPNIISAEQLSKVIDDQNAMLSKRGYTALEDHPDDYEHVAGIHLNQGTWALILLQPTEKLVQARAWLESKNYYKNWDADYKKSVQNR